MQKRLAILVAATIALALPQLALANTPNAQASVSMQNSTAFESTGGARAEPTQSIDGRKIPGASNGWLAEMVESSHAQSACPTPTDADFAALPTCP